jgi:hypothetical protein
MASDAAALDEEATRAAKKFVDALAKVLVARSRPGSASLSLRSALAVANLNARQHLDSKQYRDAIAKAAYVSEQA